MRILVFLFLFVSLFFVSCKTDKKNGANFEDIVVPEFCKADTTEVLNLVNKYLSHLKNKEFDEAFQMLYHISNDQVYNLTDSERKGIQQQYKLFPVYDYKILNCEFNNIHDTKVTYTIRFSNDTLNTSMPSTIKMCLQPQRINAVWYLGVLNESYMKR